MPPPRECTGVVVTGAEQQMFPFPKLRARWSLSSTPKFLLFAPRHESKTQIQTIRAEGQLGRLAKDNGRQGEVCETIQINSNNENIACAKWVETQHL